VPAKVITISASFGAGGSIVGPGVAKQLGMTFLDRIIPATVAEELDVPLGRALAHDEKASGLIARLIARLGTTALPYGATPVADTQPVVEEDVFREHTEEVIREVADGEGGVILGRAAAVVLRKRPHMLHVRLDGDQQARVSRVAEWHGITTDRAAALLEEADRARETYVRHFYKADAHDARLYHLKIDSIAIAPEACVQLVVDAARSIA